jgi:hypothetical protein
MVKVVLFVFFGGTLLLALGVYDSIQSRSQPEGYLARQEVRLLCVEGYTFVVYAASDKAGLSQMLTVDGNGHLTPSTCDEASYPLAIETNKTANNLQMYIVLYVIFCISCGMAFLASLHDMVCDNSKTKRGHG